MQLLGEAPEGLLVAGRGEDKRADVVWHQGREHRLAKQHGEWGGCKTTSGEEEERHVSADAVILRSIDSIYRHLR